MDRLDICTIACTLFSSCNTAPYIKSPPIECAAAAAACCSLILYGSPFLLNNSTNLVKCSWFGRCSMATYTHTHYHLCPLLPTTSSLCSHRAAEKQFNQNVKGFQSSTLPLFLFVFCFFFFCLLYLSLTLSRAHIRSTQTDPHTHTHSISAH